MRFFGQTDIFHVYCWVYVEFYESQSVVAALLKHQIKIGNDVLEIKKIERTFFNFGKVNVKINVDEIFLQAPDENSPKNILNVLNDDCLTEIFKYLSIRDQCSVLGVCARFNRISKQLLAKAASKQHKNDISSFIDLTKMLLSLPLQQANDYLRDLGSSIHTIDVGEISDLCKYPYILHIFMGMISKYCKNVRTLYIDYSCDYILNLEMFSELVPLFARLENLNFQCSGRYLDSLLPICSQLRALSIYTTNKKRTYTLPPIKLPKLVAFRWKGNRYTTDINNPLSIPALKTFISLNTQLEALSIRSSDWPFYDYDSEKHDSLIGQLKCLKFLEIDVRLNLMILPLIQEFLSKNRQMEHLILKHSIKINDEVIEYISKMKTIQKLEFHFVREFDKRYLISLALNLPNLKAMIHIAERRSKKINLILFDVNIHQIVKEVQEKMSNNLATLDVQLLKNISYEHTGVEMSSIINKVN